MKARTQNKLMKIPFYVVLYTYILLIIGITLTIIISAFSNKWIGTKLPTEWTLYNIIKSWTTYDIGRYYIISIKIVVMATIFSICCAIPTAYVLARKDFKCKGVLEKFFKLPILLPELLIGVPLASLYYQLGLAETYIGVTSVLTVLGIPLGLAILMPFIESLDGRVETAAETLGANRFVIFTQIIAPQLIPGITSTAINVFVRLFANYTLILLLGGPGTYTFTIKLFSTLLNARTTSQGMLNSLTVYYMIPMLVFTMLTLLLQNILKRRYGGDRNS